jgi:hypothetical protein
MNLTTFKSKKLAAKKGYDLLKSKADALKVTIGSDVLTFFPRTAVSHNCDGLINILVGALSHDHEEHLRHQGRYGGHVLHCIL